MSAFCNYFNYKHKLLHLAVCHINNNNNNSNNKQYKVAARQEVQRWVALGGRLMLA